MATGFAFGGAANATAPAGFNFGTPAAPIATAQPTIGFSQGTVAPTTSTSTLGTSGGFSLNVPVPTGLNVPVPTGLNVPVPASTSSVASVPILGGLLGLSATTPSTAFGLAPTATAASTGFGFPAAAATTTPAVGGGGLTFNKPLPTVAAPVFGGLLSTTTGTPATGLGLFGATSTAAAAPTITSIFSVPTTTTTVGLGGLDPKTATTAGGTGGSASKTSDGKAVREIEMHPVLVETVTAFQKYVKEEKTVREDIARMSTKPMLKVQEDTAALKQLLSVVSNGLQRNACTVDKLKREMAQELKNAEMAQRTKDIPPGLQYENTAPTIYFQQLVEDFEGRMITYRQQIEALENHLAALHQPTRHSQSELIALMKKLHETFIALAAQLQVINEAVKTQKDHYLNYRKIFHGDTKNIFERHAKPVVTVTPMRPLDPAGPAPFTGMTNAAAAAMASVLNRSQHPTGAPPVAGLNTSSIGTGSLGVVGSTLGTTGGLFGGSSLASSSGLSGSAPQLSSLSSVLASSNQTAAVKPLGLLGTSSMFNSLSATATNTNFLGASTPQTAGVPLGLAATPGAALSAGTNKPFQLQKPPQGAKRGKR